MGKEKIAKALYYFLAVCYFVLFLPYIPGTIELFASVFGSARAHYSLFASIFSLPLIFVTSLLLVYVNIRLLKTPNRYWSKRSVVVGMIITAGTALFLLLFLVFIFSGQMVLYYDQAAKIK